MFHDFLQMKQDIDVSYLLETVSKASHFCYKELK